MVSTVNAGLAATTGTKTAADSLSKLSGDYTTFLKMLTTQIQYQDPLEPMDSAAFTNQLVQFSSVEQLIASNKNLEKLVVGQTANTNTSALGYLGKEADVTGNSIYFDGTNEAQFQYGLPLTAHKVEITVYDAKGNTVRKFTAPTDKGMHAVKWDGSDDNGNKVPAGYYAVKVSSIDSAGKSTAVDTTISGKITAVGTENGQIMLTINNVPVSASNIIAVREPSNS